MEMKGSKKRKARQLDETDYTPILKPIPDTDTAQKVAAAMRQTLENKRVLSYLLQRIKASPAWSKFRD
jgi:histone-lysine N-methyltransferase SETD2